MIKDFIKDAVKYLPAQIVPGLVGFISIPIITRLFSPQDYGDYSLVITTVTILTLLSGWVPMSVMRFYPVYERDKELGIFYGHIIKLMIISILGITAVFCLLLFSAKNIFSPKFYSIMWFGTGVFIVTAISAVFEYLLRSKRQINWYNGFVIWRNVMTYGLGLLIIALFQLKVRGLLLGMILGMVIILPLLWKQVIGDVSVIYSRTDYSLVKEMAKYSFPMVIGNLAGWILNLSDRYIIEFLRGSHEVGIYSASYNVSERSMTMVSTLFMLAAGPIAMHIWENEGEEKSREFITKLSRYYLITCIPIAVGLGILAKPIMAVLTGQQYLEGYRIIPFVVSGFLIFGFYLHFEVGFLFHKKTNVIVLATIASGLLNMFLNLLFIPKYGYIAAGITTLISYAFLLFLIIILSRRFFIWKFPFKSLINSACASVMMGIIVWFFSNRFVSSGLLNLLLSVLLGGLTYFTLLFLFQEFQPEEKETMKLIIAKVFKV